MSLSDPQSSTAYPAGNSRESHVPPDQFQPTAHSAPLTSSADLLPATKPEEVGQSGSSELLTSTLGKTPITRHKTTDSQNKQGDRRKDTGVSLFAVGGSLALVLGVFFFAAWIMRRTVPAGALALPTEVFEVLGRAPLAARQQAYLLRCGSKLLLVSVTTAGAETLAEITEPDEVVRLAGLCRQNHPQSATAAFRQVFEQFAPARPRENAISSQLFDGSSGNVGDVAKTGILSPKRESEAYDV